MKKRTLVKWTLAVLALVAIGGGIWSMLGIHTVEMTEAELQQKIDEKMPFKPREDAEIKSVKLDLSGNKIGLDIAASAKKFKTELALKLQTQGTVRFESSRGSFYFKPEKLRVSDARTNGVPVSDSVHKYAEKLLNSQLVKDNKKYVDKYLEGRDAEADKKALIAMADDLVQSTLQTAAEKALERVPVYTLNKDFKGYVVRAALKDIEVRDGKVIAHISLVQLGWSLLGWLLLLVVLIGLFVLLMMNPEFGVAVLFVASGGQQ